VNLKHLIFLVFLLLGIVSCTPPKKVQGKQRTPTSTTKPPTKPSDKPTPVPTPTPTVPTPTTPNNPNSGGNQNPNAPSDFSNQKFRLAVMLPFLTNQLDSNAIPEKSKLAVQFYAGVKLALDKLSREEGMNLVIDVYDTKVNDADFETLMRNPKVDLADVYIGPIRNSQVTAMAKKTRLTRKILISPETPNTDLTNGNPNFIQINPSLQAHCEGITRNIMKKHTANQVVLVCKQKEKDRLAYFQNANTSSTKFAELIVPDATENFTNIDLKPYLKSTQSTIFVLPSWASQDFIFAFMRKLKVQKGKSNVELYGMPQWLKYESIEPDYFKDLNVRVSSATFTDYEDTNVKEFTQEYFATYRMLPNDDAYNGYDIMLYVGKMLKKYGTAFPANMSKEQAITLQGKFNFDGVFTTNPTGEHFDQSDYQENKFVHILKFENYKFVPE
jgi:Periplasmic binding protein